MSSGSIGASRIRQILHLLSGPSYQNTHLFCSCRALCFQLFAILHPARVLARCQVRWSRRPNDRHLPSHKDRQAVTSSGQADHSMWCHLLICAMAAANSPPPVCRRVAAGRACKTPAPSAVCTGEVTARQLSSSSPTMSMWHQVQAGSNRFSRTCPPPVLMWVLQHRQIVSLCEQSAESNGRESVRSHT